MAMIGSDSPPCPQKCALCHERCYGREGHSQRATAGRKFAELHQCRKHCWGSIQEMIETQRAHEYETKRELVELLSKQVTSTCLEKIRRALGIGV